MPLLLSLIGAAVSPASASAQQAADFTVHFADCSEFVGWGPADLAVAEKLVPRGYVIAGASSGTAAIVVRVTGCRSVQVDGGPAMRTRLSQIGINLVSPDGTGDINNYTLVYASNNPYLVQAFQQAGVPAKLDPGLTYDYELNAEKTGGALYAAAPSPGVPAYFFYGAESEPPAHSQQPFLANWWYGPHAKIKQSTFLPNIAFGNSTVAFYTSKASILSRLVGGNADSNFSDLSVRGEYPSGDLTVTSR